MPPKPVGESQVFAEQLVKHLSCRYRIERLYRHLNRLSSFLYCGQYRIVSHSYIHQGCGTGSLKLLQARLYGLCASAKPDADYYITKESVGFQSSYSVTWLWTAYE